MKLKIKNSQLAKAAGLDKLREKLAKSTLDKDGKAEDSDPKAKKSALKTVEAIPETPDPLGGLQGSVEKPRRIRAKNRSSFVSLSDEEGKAFSDEAPSMEVPISSIESTPNSNNNDDSLVLPIQEESSVEPPFIKENSEDSFVTDPKILETLSEPVIKEEKTHVAPPAPLRTPMSPPKMRSGFGPTGRHVKQLLPRPFTQPDHKKPTKPDSTSSFKPREPRTGGFPYRPNSRPATDESGTRTPTTPNTPNTYNKQTPTGVKKDPKKPRSDFRDTRPGAKKTGDTVKTFTGRDRYGLSESPDDERWRKKRPAKTKKIQDDSLIQRPTQIKIALPITIKDLAVEMKLKASEIIQKMFIHGMTYVVNDLIGDETTVQFIGSEFGCEVIIDNTEKDRIQIVSNTVKEEILQTAPELLVFRSPVVAFMGHVDHGKTSLIDALRQTNVTAEESGAITQHVGAFRCHTAMGSITILDTPGHEAFSAMRARGAEVCDIVVLVVAGDEGIKEQTLEAIFHARNSGIAIVVAINKSDKVGYDLEKIYRQLADNDLLPEAWGGSICTVSTSAKTGDGLNNLLETLSLQSEILELKANPDIRARGIVIESELHKGFGYIATVLVQNGTLKLGDALVLNEISGRVKTMHNENNQSLQEAGPSTPILITGLSGIPKAGDPFVVVKNEKEARAIVEARIAGQQRYALQKQRKTSFETMLQNKKTLRLIVKADVQGSVEALINSISKITSNKVSAEIVSAGIGEVSESDIRLANASKAIIIGLHTRIESHAESLLKSYGVKVFLHTIIYHAIDEVTNLMQSILDPIAEEKDLGTAEIKAIFKSSHLGTICGCIVNDGIVSRNAKAKLVRDGEVIWKGGIASLKKLKEDVREVKKGIECGILLDPKGANQAAIGNLICCYEIVYHPQTL